MDEDKINLDNNSQENKESIQNISLEEYNNLKDSLDKSQDQYKRLLAETLNIKKNADLEKKKGKLSLLLKIINIVDTYSVITKNENNTNSTDLGNLLDQLNILLETEGVHKIEIKDGDNFNPLNSEAISTQKGEADGIILAVISPAYEMDNIIIKTAKVIVSKKI